MSNRSIVSIAIVVLLGSASAAFAYDPENNIGDKYPWLDQSFRTFTARNIGGRYVPVRQIARLDQPIPEDVEARIGDRYPALEKTTRGFSAARVLNERVAMRQGSAILYYEDPESRISDKYPQLSRASPQRSGGIYRTARRSMKPRV